MTNVNVGAVNVCCSLTLILGFGLLSNELTKSCLFANKTLNNKSKLG